MTNPNIEFRPPSTQVKDFFKDRIRDFIKIQESRILFSVYNFFNFDYCAIPENFLNNMPADGSDIEALIKLTKNKTYRAYEDFFEIIKECTVGCFIKNSFFEKKLNYEIRKDALCLTDEQIEKMVIDIFYSILIMDKNSWNSALDLLNDEIEYSPESSDDILLKLL